VRCPSAGTWRYADEWKFDVPNTRYSCGASFKGEKPPPVPTSTASLKEKLSETAIGVMGGVGAVSSVFVTHDRLPRFSPHRAMPRLPGLLSRLRYSHRPTPPVSARAQQPVPDELATRISRAVRQAAPQPRRSAPLLWWTSSLGAQLAVVALTFIVVRQNPMPPTISPHQNETTALRPAEIAAVGKRGRLLRTVF